MSAQELITEHLDLWTEAVTKKSTSGRGSNGKIELTGIKKLRELILELAVRGKLVEQHNEDQPTQFTLRHIEQDVKSQVTSGQRKKLKAHSSIPDKEVPFQIPTNWTWTRIENLCELENGDRSKNYPNKSVLVSSGIPFVNAGHIDNYEINHEDMTFIPEDRFNLLRSGKFRENDILFCLRGSLGKAGIVKGLKRGAIASSLIIVRPFLENSEYIMLYLKSPLSREMVKKYDNGTAQPNLSGKDFGSFLIPLPPEKEQHRIVQKVDELMALCDQLEQQTNDQLAAHETLVDTLLGTLTQSENANELAENWARLAAHFDTLFTTEQSIDKLKQTILELSVRGLLISTIDDGGEPSEVLLSRLRNEKKQLISAKNAKDSGKMHQKAPKDPPYELPCSWTWVRFRELIWCYRGHNPPKSEFKSELQPGFVRFIQITDFKTDANKVFVPQTSRNKMVHKGEIIMAAYRHIGKLSRDMEGAFNVALCKILEFDPMDRDFVELLIRTDLVTGELLRASERGHIPSMHSDHLLSLFVPLPPLIQQRRIVKKVSELMTLCDQLKERLNQASETRCQLAEAVVKGALN